MMQRKISAEWEIKNWNSERNESFKNSLEEAILKKFQEEIEWEMIQKIYIEMGWTSVEISSSVTDEMRDWCNANLSNAYKGRDNTWLFKSEQDAEHFILRWK